MYELCAELIREHNESMTPEQHAIRRAARLESLEKAIAAGKELKEKYGIELVCRSPNQNCLDYIEITDMYDAIDQLEE